MLGPVLVIPASEVTSITSNSVGDKISIAAGLSLVTVSPLRLSWYKGDPKFLASDMAVHPS